MAKFLDEGHKVKITIMFRGREVYHSELGKKILDKIAEQMGDNAKVDNDPRLDGRNMVMVLSPNKAKKQATKATKDAANAAESGSADLAAAVSSAVPEAPTEAPELEGGTPSAKDED